MSFSALNLDSLNLNLDSPPVVGAAGLGCLVALPFAQGIFEHKAVPWALVQGINILSYGVSFWSVTKPGRNDSAKAAKKSRKKKKKITEEASVDAPEDAEKKEPEKKKSNMPKVRTLLPPDGWAFLIWAPIFVGECLMVGTQLALTEASPMAPIIRKITAPYVFAQFFQILWTASFRPSYSEGIYKYIAALNLSGIAFSLSFCHRAYSDKQARYTYPRIDYILNFLPLTLHFGWTTAASLVNWNASFAVEKDISTEEVSYFGHASAALATVLGTAITILREAPMYGSVIAYSLTAVASGLTKRIDESEKEEEKDVAFIEAAELQRILSVAGAAICTAAAAFVSFGKKQKSR